MKIFFVQICLFMIVNNTIINCLDIIIYNMIFYTYDTIDEVPGFPQILLPRNIYDFFTLLFNRYFPLFYLHYIKLLV